MRKEIEVLREFLNMSVFSADEVFEKFATDTGGSIYEINGDKFYFKMGTRKDKILLVAHADTIWDKRYERMGLEEDGSPKNPSPRDYSPAKIKENLLKFSSGSDEYGLGADDRAGAAIVWLLKDTGNSVLITDQEEIGAFSARSIMENEEFREIINSHRYILQFDLQGKKKFKCYGAGSEDFKAMMEIKTKYDMLPNYSFTDVAILGQTICGANLSTGYKSEHTPFETVNKLDWLNTVRVAKKLAQAKHQQFYVEPDFAFKYMRDFNKKDYGSFSEEFNLYESIDKEMDIDDDLIISMKNSSLKDVDFDMGMNGFDKTKDIDNSQESEPGM